MHQCLRQTRIVLAVAVLFGVFVCSAFAQDAPCEDCGPGEHWVDTCPGGVDQIEDQGALIGIDTDLDCEEDVSLVMFPCLDIPPLMIARTGPLDDSNYFPGLRPVDGHLDVIDTEIVEMCLAGGGFTVGTPPSSPASRPGARWRFCARPCARTPPPPSSNQPRKCAPPGRPSDRP